MAFTPHEFYLKYIGKQVNADGMYPGECVDLYKQFRHDIGDPNYSRAIGGDGWAYQIWVRRNVSGDATYFNFYPYTSPANLKDGDWVLWNYNSAPCPYSHVAMFRKDNGNGTGIFLGQNQKDGKIVSQENISYSGILGALRWKEWDKPSYSDSQLISETGVATLTHDSIQARLNSPTGSVVRKYNAGDKITYKWKWIGNGHRYIVWEEGTNKIFLATSNSETQGVEPWATFSAVEETSKFDESKLEEEYGLATFRNDVPIIVHKGSPDGPDSGERKLKGDTQVYKWKYVGLGHRWIVWEDNNVKYYVAVSGTEERPAAGSDDQWATFSEVPEQEETPKPEETNPGNTEEEWIIEDPDLEPEIYQPTEGWLEKFGISFVGDIVEIDEYKYKAPFVMDPQFTVTHNSGTPSNPSAQALNTSMRNDSTTQKSWHFSVDENNIVQGLPLNRNGWHSGDGRDGDGNRKGIAIEICRDMLDETDAEFTLAERNAAIFIADLMYQRGWAKETIRKHQDFADKYCPHKTLDKGWDRYVDMVLDYLDQLMQFKADSDQPAEPDQPEEGETVDGGLINTLVQLLIKLLRKLLSIFK